MRRAATDIFKSLKDQVRGVRYSIRAEAEAPGSTLPRILHDFRPVMAMGGPALRLADGLFTEVETLAVGLLVPQETRPGFPHGMGSYLDRAVALADHLYEPYKAILGARGVRAMLVSERALNEAGDLFRDRVVDLIPRGRPMTLKEVSQASAALIRALVEARPIRKVTFGETDQRHPNVMLSPNLYCAIVVGIATALLTLNPELDAERQSVLDSAGSVADVRFQRFNQALKSKAPELNIAKELDILLPFLP